MFNKRGNQHGKEYCVLLEMRIRIKISQCLTYPLCTDWVDVQDTVCLQNYRTQIMQILE